MASALFLERPRAGRRHGRVWALFLLGLAAGLGWRACGQVRHREQPGPVAVWVADRDGCELVGLDSDLFVAARRPVPWPVAVACAADGGAWVVSASARDPRGTHRLLCFDARGAQRAERSLVGFVDLAPSPDGVVIVEEPAGQPARLSTADGRRLAAVAGARCAAVSEAGVLVGTATGSLVLLDPASGRIRSVRRVAGAVVDVAPGPRAETWWALTADPNRALFLDERSAREWSTALEVDARALVPVAGEERLWLPDAHRPRAERLGPGGTRELSIETGLAGHERGAASARGELLLAAPGALLRRDRDGRALPGQGGFVHLVGVAPVPRVCPAGPPMRTRGCAPRDHP